MTVQELLHLLQRLPADSNVLMEVADPAGFYYPPVTEVNLDMTDGDIILSSLEKE